MFQTKIQWHNASKELPDKSCDVVAVSAYEDSYEIYSIQNVRYSSNHRKFNCEDDYSESLANAVGLDDVKYWAYFDDIANALSKIIKTEV